MVSEPKYCIKVANDGVSLPYSLRTWDYDPFDECLWNPGPPYNTWQAAMDTAISLGLGRKTSEADTYELDPGVEIRAVHDGE